MPDRPDGGVEILDLARLGDGYPGLSPNGGRHLAQACAVCLEDRGHDSGHVRLAIEWTSEVSYTLAWPEIGEQVRRQWNDEQEATEAGAVGVAILVVTTFSEFQVVLRSRKGTGFDYWLGRTGDPLFQHAARLEVSGIRSGSRGIIDARVREKSRQTRRTDGPSPRSSPSSNSEIPWPW